MSKLLVIGIDSLDRILLEQFADDLPTFTRLRSRSPSLRMRGVYPPDSPVSWASIFTGVNPARHGILEFVDPLDKTSMRVSKEIDNSYLRGKTFWDVAGRKGGKKVCILLPALGFPVWEVNGYMAGRSSIYEEVQVFDSDHGSPFPTLGLSNLRGVVGRSPDRFIENAKDLLQREKEFTLSMLKNRTWDLFFTYSSVLDPIQHGFWNFFDKQDPTHTKDNRYRDVIRDFYIAFDDVVRQYCAAVDSDTTVMILSDHGHCMRPVHLLNINEILRREGLLVLRQNAGSPMITTVEKTKRLLLKTIVKYRLGNLALIFMRMFPGSKNIYTSPLHIDWPKTTAYLSDLSGIKAYTYGGIKIEIDHAADPSSYETIRNRVIRALSEVTEPDSGKPYMKWVCRREEVYTGEYLERYPDVLFRLQDQYGAGWMADGGLVGSSLSHNIQPGSHNEETPVILLVNMKGRECARNEITLLDVAPTILDLLGLTGTIDSEGTSILM